MFLRGKIFFWFFLDFLAGCMGFRSLKAGVLRLILELPSFGLHWVVGAISLPK